MNRIRNTVYKKSKAKKPDWKKTRILHMRAGGDSTNKVTSTSEKKLTLFKSDWKIEDLNEDQENLSDYLLIHKDQLAQLCSDEVCELCGVKSVCVTAKNFYGFSSKIIIYCSTCSETIKELSSSIRIGGPHSVHHVNKKMVEAMLLMGQGYAGLQKFCLIMNMSIMSSKTFNKILMNLSDDFSRIRDEMLKVSRKKVRDHYLSLDSSLEEESVLDLTISYDGTWQKRGFKSLYGIGVVIELYTGLVIDFEVLSKYCRVCVLKKNSLKENSTEFQSWLETHANSGECQQNFLGNSGAIEVKAAEVMWLRSIKEQNVRYIHMLSDGDSKTFNHLSSIKVYGADVNIYREQCLNHVSKCLITAFKNIVKEYKVKKVTLGGKKAGALTDKVMHGLAGYYRNAIVNNVPHVTLMQNAIIATLDHYSSTDSEPKHELCPSGLSTWCWHNKAVAQGLKPPSHHTRRMKKINQQVIVEKNQSTSN